MLVDGRLAHTHRDAEDEDEDRERQHPQLVWQHLAQSVGLELLGHLEHDVSVRHRQQQRRHEHGAERRVHDPSGAEPVGQVTADRAQQARGEDEQGGEQSRLVELQPEDVDVVLGQPGGEGNVRAEDGDVVEAEPPDPHLAQRPQHLTQRAPLTGLAVSFWRHQPHRDRHHDQEPGVEEWNEAPASRDQAAPVAGDRDDGDERRADQLGDGGADVARPEDPEGEPLAPPRGPGRVPGDPNAE